MDSSTGSPREQGIQALRAGRLDEALALLAQALRTDGRDAEAWASLGVAYSQKGLHTDALQALRSAVALQPQNNQYRFSLEVAQERARDGAAGARPQGLGAAASARPTEAEPTARAGEPSPADGPGLGGTPPPRPAPPGKVPCPRCGEWQQPGLRCKYCTASLQEKTTMLIRHNDLLWMGVCVPAAVLWWVGCGTVWDLGTRGAGQYQLDNLEGAGFGLFFSTPVVALVATVWVYLASSPPARLRRFCLTLVGVFVASVALGLLTLPDLLAPPQSRPSVYRRPRPAVRHPAFAPTRGHEAGSTVVRPTRSFSYDYQYKPKGPRHWRQVDAQTWLESHPDGSSVRHHVVGRGMMDNAPGTVVRRQDGAVEVFIPDQGSQTRWLRFRPTRDSNWYYLGKMYRVR